MALNLLRIIRRSPGLTIYRQVSQYRLEGHQWTWLPKL